MATYATANCTWKPEEPKRHNAHKDWKSYEFDVRSLDQIDDQVISRDLSWTNPMMIMEVDAVPEYFRVYIDESIFNKATSSGPTYKETWNGQFEYTEHRYYDRLDKLMTDGSLGYGWIHRRFLPTLIRLVKEIKQADWNKPCRATCKVIKIAI